MTYGAVTANIIMTHAQHPEWTANDIAAFLDLESPEMVRELACRVSIRLPSKAQKHFIRANLSDYKRPYVKPPYAGKY